MTNKGTALRLSSKCNEVCDKASNRNTDVTRTHPVDAGNQNKHGEPQKVVFLAHSWGAQGLPLADDMLPLEVKQRMLVIIIGSPLHLKATVFSDLRVKNRDLSSLLKNVD